MTYVISRAKIRRCGGQIDTSLARRREAARGGGHSSSKYLVVVCRPDNTNYQEEDNRDHNHCGAEYPTEEYYLFNGSLTGLGPILQA
jgi:hypothetical protein